MRRFRSTAKRPVGDLMTGFRTFQWSNLACPGLWLGGSCYYITNEMVKTSSNADMNICVFTKVIIPPPICRNIPAEFFCQFFVNRNSLAQNLAQLNWMLPLATRARQIASERFHVSKPLLVSPFCWVSRAVQTKNHWAKRDFLLPRFSKYLVSINRLFLWYFLPSTFFKTYYPKTSGNSISAGEL